MTEVIARSLFAMAHLSEPTPVGGWRPLQRADQADRYWRRMPDEPPRSLKDRFFESFPVGPSQPGGPPGFSPPLGSPTTVLGGIVILALLVIPFVLCR